MVHVQGCTLGCGGCFNPETHDAGGGTVADIDELADWLAEHAKDGVTVSGGEPFQQAPALAALAAALRQRGVASLMVFTGYDLAELAAIPSAAEAMAHLDVLVAGRFEATQRTEGSIAASANQRLHFLTDRHAPEDFDGQGGVEISILPDGQVVLTGFPSPALRRGVRALGQLG